MQLIPLVQERLSEVRYLCEQYQIARLWIFGSAVSPGSFTPESDLDFLYEFEHPEAYDPAFPYAANWSDMLTALRRLFGRPVQLIAYGPFTNPWFRASVEQTKYLLYEKHAAEVAV